MSSKFNFTIKEVVHKNIIERYSLSIPISEENIVQNVTKISDLTIQNKTEHISFLDDVKNNKNLIITMKDFLTKESIPKQTNISCYWCRHKFDTIPIGCPIRYIPSQYEKKYFSEITKDKYVIRQNITNQKKNIIQDKENIIDKEYYETDGIFCSFNCCLAFIEDRRLAKNSLYNQSFNLLMKIYTEVYFDKGIETIPPLVKAPHWRLLKEYGGVMSIDEFRKTFFSKEYILNGKIREIPKFKTIGFIFNEKQV